MCGSGWVTESCAGHGLYKTFKTPTGLDYFEARAISRSMSQNIDVAFTTATSWAPLPSLMSDFGITIFS
jgi:hypothetical protein